MAKTLKQLQPHKFSAGDTVKVVRSGTTEWCKIGDTHTIRICKHDHEDGPVYVVDDDKDDAWIRECNLELVERDRQKGGEWKRARGRKPNYETETPQRMEVRHRDGDITKGWTSQSWNWSHNDGCPSADIMAWRIIIQPQAEEVEVNAFVGKDVKLEYAFSQEGVEMEDLEWKPIGGKLTSVEGVDPALFGTLEDAQPRDTLSTYKEFTVTGQWHQIDGPIKWRDTIIHCQAIIEDCEREIERNVQRLAGEGFVLAHPITRVMAPVTLDEFKSGDILRCIDVGITCADLTIDKEYTVCSRNGDIGIIDDEGDHMMGCIDSGELEFIRRP